MKSHKIKAFTLVELIIVITILAILRTIGFMSYQSYTLDARDGNRVTTLKEISNGLEIHQTKNQVLPTPDAQIVTTLDSSGNTISIQGYLGTNIQKIIKLTNETKDPKDNNYYTYSTNGSKTKYQLLTLLENNPAIAYNENTKLLNQTYARTDYTTRYPYTTGNKVGIFFTGITNQPLQETNSGTLALSLITTQMKVMFSNAGTTSSGIIISTGSSLPAIVVTETKSTATTGGNIGSSETTYAISSCSSPNTAKAGTSPTKAAILSDINSYIGCNVTGGKIAGYTYSGSILPENKMVMVVENTDTAGALTTQWGLWSNDLSTLSNLRVDTNTTTIINDIVSWDGLSNTQKILVGLTQAGESGRAAQLCNAKGAGTRYLPATEELNQLYCYNNNNSTNDAYYLNGVEHADCLNKGYIEPNKNTLNNFAEANYWSSTESNYEFSRYQHFGQGYRVNYNHKNNNFAVRCVSRF